MQIEYLTTTNISSYEWESYTIAFNQVFEKEYTLEYFQNKYNQSIDRHSYHTFLKEGNDIVGACTVIPYEYLFENETIRCGLAVDVFILPEFRTDPLALYRMYKILKKELIQINIALVIAIPNDVAYPYWKNVVKWKDIGFLNYYALPVKFGKVVAKLTYIFNLLNSGYIRLILFLSNFIFSNERLCKIRIKRTNKIIEKQRYTQQHVQLSNDDFYFSYRIVEEEGIKTCYLIDFYNIKKGNKDAQSLKNAIKTLVKIASVDIIVFVGKLSFSQLLLIKIPFKYEPKHLYFTSDILIPEKINDDLISNIKNWDFGLFNYDVR